MIPNDGQDQDLNFTIKFFPQGQQQPQSFQGRIMIVLSGFVTRIERCDLGELEPSLYLAFGGIGALHLIGALSVDEQLLWRDRAKLAALIRGWKGGANIEAVRSSIVQLEARLRSGR